MSDPDPESPVLEMLWEADDPGQALQRRFGFDDVEAAAHWVAVVLSAQWGIAVSACDRTVISDQNALAWVETSSGPMIAKWSVARNRFPRLRALARLTADLASQGLPVSAPVPSRDGRLQLEIDGVSLGLQRRISGDLLDTSDPRQISAAGAVLARLHRALGERGDADRIPDLSICDTPLTTRVAQWLDSYPDHLPVTGRDVLRRLAEAADPDPLTTQLVHGDFRSANVLWSGSGIAAVLDFEESRVDCRVVELARSAVLLGTRFRHWGPVPAEVHARLLGAYQAHHRLTPAEASWWEPMVLWHSLAMVPAGDDPTGWGAAVLDLL